MKSIHIYRIGVLFILFLIGIGSTPQEIPVYYHTQYLSNPYLINPAIAGSKDFTAINLSLRQYITNIDGSPKTQILSAHSRLGKPLKGSFAFLERSNLSNVGVGAYLYNDIIGVFHKIGFQATYAYHVPLSRKKLHHLAFGISGNLLYYSINKKALNIINDPLFTQGGEGAFVPDVNFGMYYYDVNFYCGISTANMLETPINLGKSNYVSIPIQREYFLYTGYKILIHEETKLIIEPSILVRANDDNIGEFYNNMDLNLKIYYRTFYLGSSLRMGEDVAFMMLYQFANLTLGLSYEYPLSNVWNHTHGIAEVAVGFNFGKGVNRFHDSRYW